MYIILFNMDTLISFIVGLQIGVQNRQKSERLLLLQELYFWYFPRYNPSLPLRILRR